MTGSRANLPCPVCGFCTLTGSGFGSYEICRVCDWEDDGVQLANPACGGGANAASFLEAQAAALARFPRDVVSAHGFARDPAWRPLSDAEVAIALREREEQCWRNQGVVEPADAYWAKDLGSPSSPPGSIDGARLVRWAPIDARHRRTDAGCSRVDGGAADLPAAVVVCEDLATGGFFLFHCDVRWRVLADTWHESLERASAQAESEFPGLAATWR